MTLNIILHSAIDRSLRSAIQRMINDGVPVGIDAIRCHIGYHTARGWQSLVSGDIVNVQNGDGGELPEPDRSSHRS